MSETIPVIDLGPLLSGGEEGRKAVAAEIGAACRGIGFFYVCNHGVPPELREEVFATAARFFESPEEVKRTALYSAASGNRGFIPMKGESLDPTKAPDLKEAFNIGLEMAEDDPEIVAGARFRGLNLWPEMGGLPANDAAICHPSAHFRPGSPAVSRPRASRRALPSRRRRVPPPPP